MVIKCPKCDKENDDSAILCVHCGEILSLDASTAQVLAKKGATARSGSLTGENENIPISLKIVREGLITDEEIELGSDDFELILGRYDFDHNIIPDIDLTKWLTPIKAKEGTLGYSISRKQAKLERKLGVLSITQLGNAKIFIRPKGETDWITLNLNETRPLQVGDRIFFGTKESNVVFEVF